MKRNIIYILLVLTIVSIKGNAQESKTEFIERIEVYYQINDSLKPICDEIANIKTLNFSTYNLGKTDSYASKLYNRLIDNCASYELYALAYHKSPMVKIFAYAGLNKRNKTLLMMAIRDNIKDTSSVDYSYKKYYNDIYGSRVSVMYMAIEMAYWGYWDQNLSITLNEKDIKYINRKYEENLKQIVKKFEPYEVTLDGELQKTVFGPIIMLDRGSYRNGDNHYYIKKTDWKADDYYAKDVKVTGTVKLYYWFRKHRKPSFGMGIIAPPGPWYLVKYIDVKEIVIK